MKVGDRVEWSSQAGGYKKKKTGEIIMVVNPGINARKVLLKDRKFGKLKRMFDGWPRNHESYLVKVIPGTTGNASPVVYWPRVKGLKVVGGVENV